MHRQAQRQVVQEEVAAKAERKKDRRKTAGDLLTFLAILIVVSAFWVAVGPSPDQGKPCGPLSLCPAD